MPNALASGHRDRTRISSCEASAARTRVPLRLRRRHLQMKRDSVGTLPSPVGDLVWPDGTMKSRNTSFLECKLLCEGIPHPMTVIWKCGLHMDNQHTEDI